MRGHGTYKDAGVDIAAGDAFVKRIKGLVESTFGPRFGGNSEDFREASPFRSEG